jgi:hypothetical protein
MKQRKHARVSACRGRHLGVKRSQAGCLASIDNDEGAHGRRSPSGPDRHAVQAGVAVLAQATSLRGEPRLRLRSVAIRRGRVFSVSLDLA